MADKSGCEILTDAAWAVWEPLIEQSGRVARRRRRNCGGQSRRSSGGTRTARSGAASRPNWVRGGWRRSSSFAGEAGRLGAPARSRPAARHRAWHDLSRRHQHPGSSQGGGRTKKGVDSRQRDVREALGRSRGGYGTKACVIADGRGRAIAFALAPGQAHELPLAPGLLGCLPDVPGWIVGDRGFASDAFRERIWNLGARPAIPPRRTDPPVACPEWIYNNRHLVENLWARLKEWRAVATRYDKTARSFLGILCLAATADWLK